MDLPNYADRFVQVLTILCREPPPLHLVYRWLLHQEPPEEYNLQDWAREYSTLPWTMGITVLEAAELIARQPDENITTYLPYDSWADPNPPEEWATRQTHRSDHGSDIEQGGEGCL